MLLHVRRLVHCGRNKLAFQEGTKDGQEKTARKITLGHREEYLCTPCEQPDGQRQQ